MPNNTLVAESTLKFWGRKADTVELNILVVFVLSLLYILSYTFIKKAAITL